MQRAFLFLLSLCLLGGTQVQAYARRHPVARVRGRAAVRSVLHRHGRVALMSRTLAGRRIPLRPTERFYVSSFTADPGLITSGDVTAVEDPVVRAAALQALGNMNGTVLAIDPSSGRILAMVNQKLALSSGAEPCSTIKVAVALAALKEGLVTAQTPVNLGGHYSLDLTTALARSVNLYFEVLGRAMGFERVKHYANEFGLGELAGYGIPGEQLAPTRIRSCRTIWAAWAVCARLARASR